MEKLHIYSDGGARGNPGPAAIGILFIKEGKIIKKTKKFIGKATNNQAEYTAILTALKQATTLGAIDVNCTVDSELVQRQLTGKYKVRNTELKILYDKVKKEEENFDKVAYRHANRTNPLIMQADALVNQALDENI